MTSFDVIVAGAGPAGAVVARQIALAGHRVLLVDDPKEGSRPGESLPGAARALLTEMGLLDVLQRSASRPCLGNLSSWGDEVLYSGDFIRDPNGLGWHLDRNQFDACLREAAYEAGVVEWRGRLIDTRRASGNWDVVLEKGHASARFLVDASGRRSIIAQRLGIARHRDAAMIALHARAEHSSRDRRTLIEATPDGWWYTAPLPGGERIAVLHVLVDDASRILRDASGWCRHLAATRHIRQFCSTDATWSTPRGADAGGSALETFSGEDWLAVGDAALAFDPLSSQGIFNAFYSAMRGAQAVNAALAGRLSEIELYRARLGQVRQTYLQRLKYFYGVEQRWSEQPFWRERSKG